MSLSSRSAWRGIGVTAALLMAVLPLGSAQAISIGDGQGHITASVTTAGPPSHCTITGFKPNKIVLGASVLKQRFSVSTSGCTREGWAIFLRPYLSDPDHDRTLDHFDPVLAIKPKELNSDYEAGVDLATVMAWGEEDCGAGHCRPPAETSMRFRLLRRSTFDSTFNATPEPVTKGEQVKLQATLKRAVWSSGMGAGVKPHYVGYAKAKVRVQFKAAGASSFSTVKTVTTGLDAKVNTTVTATKTGTWRLYFGGVLTTASTTSTSDKVEVN